ncbi:MAG TPA: hypothetical protein VIK90_04460 [Limnochordales bacterium]
MSAGRDGPGEPVDLIMTANGPGEIAGWLYPVVTEVRRRLRLRPVPGLRLIAWAPPCNFASGRELEALAGLGPWDGLFGPREMWAFMLRGRLPAGYRPARRGLVLFLGGDLFYAALTARRLGFAAMAYTEGRARWLWAYERFFVPNRQAASRAVGMGAPPQRVEVVGDLVVDAVAARSSRPAPPVPDGVPTVGLFAGSRDFEVRWVLPMFVEAAAILRRRLGRPVRVLAVVSPFASEEALRAATRAAGAEAGAIEWVRDAGWAGEARGAAMRRCHVAITVPGTVTAELGALGVPAVTVLPLHRPELIPLEGVMGLLGALPPVGPRLKAAFVRRAARRLGPVAIPSRRAGRRLAPELVGEVSPEAIADEALALLQDEQRRRAVGEAEREAMGPAGAAARIVDRVWARLGLAEAAP